MHAGLDVGRDFAADDRRANWQAAGQGFGGSDYVRLNVVILVGEQRAGAPHAGLYFVYYQQYVIVRTNLLDGSHVFRRRDMHAAFALYRFQHNSHRLVVNSRLKRLDVIERHMREARQVRVEALADFILAGCRHGSRRPAVE